MSNTTSQFTARSDDFMEKFFDHVDANKQLYIDRLAEAVAIPSISAELDEHLDDVNRMMSWTADHITRLGGQVQLLDNPVTDHPLPPILLGEFKSDPKKKVSHVIYNRWCSRAIVAGCAFLRSFS
jgi:nonspecific dipeptidase